jgi:hypothetical protein
MKTMIKNRVGKDWEGSSWGLSWGKFACRNEKNHGTSLVRTANARTDMNCVPSGYKSRRVTPHQPGLKVVILQNCVTIPQLTN